MRRSSTLLLLRVTAVSNYLVFPVNKQLHADQRCPHDYWLALIIAVWGRDIHCPSKVAGYTNAQTSLNVPTLHTWGVGMGFNMQIPCNGIATLLKMGSYSSTTMCQYWTIANLLSSILTILLTCPNNDTVLCYSNDSFLTVYCIQQTWFELCLKTQILQDSYYIIFVYVIGGFPVVFGINRASNAGM